MYYPKQGAMYDDDTGRIRGIVKSKAQWQKVLKNFFLRRKSPSYSVCIWNGQYCGQKYKVMCRDKWALNPVSGNLTNTIVLQLQGERVINELRSRFAHDTAQATELIPEGIIAAAYPNGKITMHTAIVETLIRWRVWRRLNMYLTTHYNKTTANGVACYVSKEFEAQITPRTPVQSVGTTFNQHMNQWAV